METNLQKAILELNSPVNPFEFAIEGDEVIATWKWMDATFFKPGGISKEVQDYEFHVKIDSSRHKWHEKDITGKTSTEANFKDGKITFGSSSFSGHTASKQIVIGLGKDNSSGETGAIGFKLDTALIKTPLRRILSDMGYKKALF